MSPKPTSQYREAEPNMKSTKFFISIGGVFYQWGETGLTNAKPGCIKIPSMAASNIQTVLTPETNGGGAGDGWLPQYPQHGGFAYISVVRQQMSA